MTTKKPETQWIKPDTKFYAKTKQKETEGSLTSAPKAQKPETLWVELTLGETKPTNYVIGGSDLIKGSWIVIAEKELPKLRAAQPKGIFRDGIEICSSCMKPFDEPSIPYPYKCCWVCLEHYKKNALAAQPKSKILAYEEGKEFGMDLAYNDYDYKLREARAAGIAQGRKDMLGIVDEADKHNPYPADIFIEKTKEDWARLSKALQKEGIIQDGFFGSFGRTVWRNCIDEIKKEAQKQEQEAKG